METHNASKKTNPDMDAAYFFMKLNELHMSTKMDLLMKIGKEPNVLLLSYGHFLLYKRYIELMSPMTVAIESGKTTFMGSEVIEAKIESSPMFLYDLSIDLAD